MTDNLVDGNVIHPPEVVRHDEPDPYLVVAADKGTAHLSDTANRVSAQYGFWLGDAFASGGSNGYDHKKEGITARGAWECVQAPLPQPRRGRAVRAVHDGRHRGHVGRRVRERRRSAAATTRLVAAFNHVHIFLDPNPDPLGELRRARAAVPPAALDVAGLQPVAHQRGRRHLRPRRRSRSR